MQKVLTYAICRQMDEKPHWHFVHHIGMCMKFDVEISCKKVAYNYMWVAPYIRNCIQHNVSIAIVATCPLAFKAI